MCCRYELFIDELPVWGFVGPPPEETKGDDNIYVYTHKAFDIDYNDNRVCGTVGVFHRPNWAHHLEVWAKLVLNMLA